VSEQIEKAVLNAYLWKHYNTWQTWKNQRLGPVPPSSFLQIMPADAAKYAKQFRYFADAVVSDGKKIIIIEAKVDRPINAIGQLLLYKDYFPKTPEFQSIKDLPVEMELVVVRDDLQVRESCLKQGIRFVVFEEGQKLLPIA
jgi:hypothetical protein